MTEKNDNLTLAEPLMNNKLSNMRVEVRQLELRGGLKYNTYVQAV